jgi:hypothetical protein
MMETMGDFPLGTTHIILISSVNEDKMVADKKVLKTFKSALVGRLSRELPSMALCSYSFGGDPFSLFADYVGRKLPLICIDSRPCDDHDQDLASNTADVAELMVKYVELAKKHLESVDQALFASGSWNFFDCSMISYLHSLIESFIQARLRLETGSSKSSGAKKMQVRN